MGVCAPCPLCRSLLAFGSNPASRATRTPGTRTHRPRRSHGVAAARNLQRHVSEALQRRVSGTTPVGRSGSCAARRGTGLDPGPCSPCTAATSRAVDAHIRSELESHTKPGLHTRRLPQRAVSSPQLKPWRLAIARRIGSMYPCTSR